MGGQAVAEDPGVPQHGVDVVEADVPVLRCCELPGIRGAGPTREAAWLAYHRATVVDLRPDHVHTPLRARNSPIALRIADRADGIRGAGYVLVGNVVGTVNTQDLLDFLTWVPDGTRTGYDLAYIGVPPVTLWAYLTPVSVAPTAHFRKLAAALEHQSRRGGLLMSQELSNPAYPGKREYFVVHPANILGWVAQHPYCCGVLRDGGPCSFFADLDGGLAEAPLFRDAAFGIAEAWKVVDEVVAVLAEWGVTVGRGDFRFDRTPRANKFSIHVLSDGFYFETEWLARQVGRYVYSRLYARADVYHFVFTDSAGDAETRIAHDPAVNIRHGNFRIGGKRTAGAERGLIPTPIPRGNGRDHPDPAAQQLRGMPQYVVGDRCIGYADFNEVGKTWLECLREVRAAGAPVVAHRYSEVAGDVPAWFHEDRVADAIDAMGFTHIAHGFHNRASVRVNITGVRAGREESVRCPCCHRRHRNGYGSVFAILERGRSNWRCFKNVRTRARLCKHNVQP